MVDGRVEREEEEEEATVPYVNSRPSKATPNPRDRSLGPVGRKAVRVGVSV